MNFFSRRSLLAVTVLAVGTVAGCGAVTTYPAPSPDLTVTASISAATLGNDCGTSGSGVGLRAGDCAQAASDAGTGLGRYGGCGFCQQSNMQIAFEAGAGEGSATIEVVTVRLLDATSGATLDTLNAREPQRWNESTYVAWDQQLAAATQVRSSYKLSAPDWNRVGDGNGWGSYSRRFVLEVVLRIDGVERTIRSAELTREPEVVT